MKAVFINYCFTPDWIKDYDFDYIIYDRSDDGKDWLKDFPPERIIKTTNVGNVDYDRLSFLVDHYKILPDVFLLAKSNLFKYISKEEFDAVKNNQIFTPLLTKNHKTYADPRGPVCFYENGMYHERNDSWYFNELPHNFRNYNEFARHFLLPTPQYIPFAPGGNYILTKEVVHKWGKEFYDKMRQILPYCANPAEAHCVERTYYTLWK